MKVLQRVISGAALIALAGCSVLGADGKRIDYGAGAKQLSSLEVPPDLTVPRSDDRFKIPQGEDSASATYSDYSKDSGTKNRLGTVLPELQWVRLERDGARRWLVLRDTPENVWPVVKSFWQENGLALSSEEPAAGLMETGWAENRATRRSEGLDAIGQAYDSARTAGTRDQYLTRLERGKDGASTEIYISHRGIEEVVSANGRTIKWKARASDPELEAIMLQRLMVRLGAGEAQAASALEPIAAAASPAVTPADSAAEPVGTASLREVAGGNVIIVVNDAFDRSWRKVGLAIENSGLAVEDKDREKGIYYLRPIRIERSWLDSLMFWRSDEDTRRQYRVNVKDGGATCEVTVTDQDGAGNKASKQMLEALYKNINRQ
ncbi:MAG: outer membrane protein assembly factor BamC [Nitrosomonadales bacterium]|nr:outer membrane protein assembly factor BamC [Nitrosomonadales bacterium]